MRVIAFNILWRTGNRFFDLMFATEKRYPKISSLLWYPGDFLVRMAFKFENPN